jgi:hypothetical protein
MFKYIKHITAILLIIAFPVSAIGMDISVHSCRGKSTVHFTFLKSFSPKKASTCCCSAKTGGTTAGIQSKPYCGNKNEDLKKVPCCNSSSVYLSLAVESDTSDNASQVLASKSLLPIITPGINFEIAFSKSHPVRELRYPIKEPVFDIISYIHFTSSGSGDTADIPHTTFC